MATEQINTVLDHTRRIHRYTSEWFANLASSCQVERSRMLLDYLSNHERELADAVASIEEDASKKVLHTWVQTTKDTSRLVDELEHRQSPAADASWDDLIEFGLKMDEQVVGVYEDLATRSDQEWVRDMFHRMLDMEREEEKHVVRQALRGTDL